MMIDDKMTLVMVEDDPGHALLIEKNLRRSGIMNPIIQFDNGRTVLDYLLSDNINPAARDKLLLFLDLNLPEVDGFEVLETLKRNEKTKMIPVIILTTTNNPREIDRCYALGCNVYITKPVEYTQFSEALAKLGMMLAIVKLPHSQERV